jgi:FkbM family methyltransferase
MSLVARVADAIGRDSVFVRALRPVYARALAARYRDTGLAWTLNGTPVRIHPDCREQMGQVYDPSVVAWLRPRVRPGQTVWNVGANVGAYTLQLAAWVGPTGHVLAVEPNPAARQLLAQHCAWSGVRDRVTILGAAVGERPGTATLYVDGASPMSAVGRPNPLLAHPSRVDVPVTTLDALLATHPRPDWLVMDIEGYELHALAGGPAFAALRPRVGIVCELHPDVWPTLGQSGADLDARLAEMGRTIVPLRGDDDPHDAHAIVALAPDL